MRCMPPYIIDHHPTQVVAGENIVTNSQFLSEKNLSITPYTVKPGSPITPLCNNNFIKNALSY